MTGAQKPSADPGPVVVVDVGARWGVAEAWRALAPDLRVFGFDPDPDECARLNDAARAAGDEITTYVPVALGPRRETVDLYVTRQPACSSIYPPMVELIELMPVLAEIEVDTTIAVDLEPLDGWCQANGVGHVDVLKVDTQGSDLGVLQGAVRALSTCVLVECEVEFNPIYAGQPLFSQVDEFLRAQGFVLWRLDNLTHYTDGDVHSRLDAGVTVRNEHRSVLARIGGGQLYWADGYWVRAEFCGPAAGLDPVLARRAARVARAAGLPDLAARILPDSAPELVAEAQEARRTRHIARKARKQAARKAAGRAPMRPVASRTASTTLQRWARLVARRARSTARRLARRG